MQKSGVSKAEAEDVVQDVFVKMLETEAQIPANKLRAWMYRVSIRRYIDRYRRDRRYLEILRRDFFHQEEFESFDEEDYDVLYQAIEDLPGREAVLLDLYYFQHFTVKEIAQILSYSVSRVKVQLMRSRVKLRQELEKKGYHHGNI